ncbi:MULTISPECIES: 2-hydroxychromene-2-carboxylate isomerase [unclassified Janthinobacterium]|uniref:2-hydroxychromene-2-carboxylate isomerase n=1 Tax=unclassified Janthinobacterium TaxID=2610881 RepID=UPI001613CE0E|nr:MULTISPECIES: 2-hydroxychromene-2-carboxylate isomerase [unclassified Janthinobacterium]MBB5367399.1 2-hydroxychromene-2-carboxylate isomerase [Janthinobacterium sp. K2C7]MBB5380123.1 2-hydroxychromene-2-carboxylate isomerase [Janthinobacterium sp. K2Li3]MBB5385781.1 2-hydroxychromene-2-carboxylate isomerase [Janthinobacterium sp. K2E3]
MSHATLEFWFDFGSNYSYLSAMRIEALAREKNVEIIWKPFLLGVVFKALGWETSPFVLQKLKGDYAWRDMQRLCEKYGLPWRQPTTFPRTALLPMRVALIGADQGWVAPFVRRMMTMNFADDRDIDNLEAVTEALTELSLDAPAILALALTDTNKLRLRRQTEQAQARGLFGAPNFISGDELFWGNDRLEDALAWAAASSH